MSKKKLEKMTLKCYFDSIPKYTSPRKDFISEVAHKCGVTEQTVRNWCIYGIKPSDYKYLKVLSEVTGIGVNDLF